MLLFLVITCLLSHLGFGERINYHKIVRANYYMRNGAEFVATRCVGEYSGHRGRVLPGPAAMVSAIEASSGVNKQPRIIGKPFISKEVLRRIDVDSSKTMMIGDRFDTAIAFCQKLGMRTLLAKSGIDTRVVGSAFKTDFVLFSIVDLVDY